MKKFTTLTGVAAPMNLINIDTDMIIPKQFLKTITRSGLGKSLFFEMRYDDAGKELPDFVLNQKPYRNAEIIVAGDNFGCGSSREHAPWALEDFGIRAVIAPSFADIFFGNCYKNGMLPIVLKQEEIDVLMADAASDNARVLTIDLPNQKVIRANGESFSFEINPTSKTQLLEGLDEIGQTLQRNAEIASFEQRQHQSQPWLWS
ncbi:MAG TPA: 3-isopropylmalate dehydratase small subunit [Alphaproteobacteria bacterium]|jgi:3-isopropylmalate/(R)-2-methylmalate dehydratase small subunit|nr:3-isopropylmalate dehydratase small subunit [Alphaproteobacteria bacterium]